MLDNFILTYHITILPNVILYSAMTKASEYINFKEDLHIPSELKDYPIHCFFNIYDLKGNHIHAAQEQTFALSLKAIINTVPLKMLKEIIQNVKE